MNSDLWNQRYNDGHAEWSEDPSPGVAALTQSLVAGDALEMACGTGRNARYLAGTGWNVTAVDFASVALDIARTRESPDAPRVAWLNRDLLRWTPPESAFDLVLMTYLQIPWDSFRSVLSSAETAVRPGGFLYVLGHDRTNITKGTGRPKHPDVTYTADDVATALTRCTVIRAETEKRTADHGSEGRPDAVQIDCAVYAQRR